MKDIPLIFFCDPCFYATGQKFKPLDCYTVTWNNPGHASISAVHFLTF